MEVRVEATPDELEELRGLLQKELGDDADIQEVASSAPGELREPLLVGLVVALGGPAVVAAFVTVTKRWMQSREKLRDLDHKHEQTMAKIENSHELEKLKLKQKAPRIVLLKEDGVEPVSLDQLQKMGA